MSSTHTITLIPGDGIGPEISKATQQVIEATGVFIKWEVVDAGGGCDEWFHCFNYPNYFGEE